ncbi:uncharacterized protein LOC144542745 [Centroberyx gerrardi]
MAPVGMAHMLGELRSVVWSSSPEVGIISLFILLILSITLLALCLKCRRNTGNAYDVSGTTTDGPGGANGTAGAKKGANDGNVAYTEWRDHRSMPANTLERSGGSST